MKYVLDASVAVAAFRPNEPQHAASLARVQRLYAGQDEIVVPALFPIEVMAALVRRGSTAGVASQYVSDLLQNAHVFTLGARAARRIMVVVAATGLRAADASYVWLAMRDNVPFVTLDKEVHSCAAATGLIQHP